MTKRYAGRTTPYVCFTCFVAAFGGALFGYDLGKPFASCPCCLDASFVGLLGKRSSDQGLLKLVSAVLQVSQEEWYLCR